MSEYDKLKPFTELKSTFDKKGKRKIAPNKVSPKRQKFLDDKKANEQREKRNQRAQNTHFDKSDRRPLPEDKLPPVPFHKNLDYIPSPDFVSFATLRNKTRIKSHIIESLLCELNLIDTDREATAQGLHLVRKGRDGKSTYHKSVIDLIKQQHNVQFDESVIFEI